MNYETERKNQRKEHIEKLEKSDPKLAEKLKELYNHGEDSES